MNTLLGTSSLNPSGLDAEVGGNPRSTRELPQVVRGAKGKALQIDATEQFLRVSGPGHRYECFGDLDLCPNGKKEIKALKVLKGDVCLKICRP